MSQHPRLHIGMRMLKTALSIAIISILYHFIPTGSPQIASIASVYSQRASLNQSFDFAKQRVLAMFIGVFASIVAIFLLNLFPEHFLITGLVAGIGTLMVLWLSNLSHSEKAIVGATATFFIIFYTIPESNRYFYAMIRIMDTFIGGFIALFIEFLFPRKRTLKFIDSYNKKVPRLLKIHHSEESQKN